MITYEQFKELYDAIGGFPEFPVFFDEKCEDDYMIIKYDDGPTFQRCFGEGYRALGFLNLDELYHATIPDGICRERDWSRITRIMLGDAFYLDIPKELQDCWNEYVPPYRQTEEGLA